MSLTFYNEFDPHAAAWLRQLIAEGLIPPGDVDERSITEIKPHELSKYTQCHFFAGIGGWSLALQLAGWPADRPVWTGSCPCQPFSVAGKGKGSDDERHVWPAFFNLIDQCRPDTVFGEQVESAIGHGWLDGIRADLEGEAYAVGAVVLGAHSVGAPHRRQRLYWVADSQLYRRSPRGRDQRGEEITRGPHWDNTQRRSVDGGRLADSQGDGRHQECQDGGRGDDGGATQRGAARLGLCSANHWAESIWISCRDGKHRRAPAEPALCPLVDGIPYQLARRGSVRPSLLKGAGNAIVPQVGAAFIQAFLTPC